MSDSQVALTCQRTPALRVPVPTFADRTRRSLTATARRRTIEASPVASDHSQSRQISKQITTWLSGANFLDQVQGKVCHGRDKMSCARRLVYTGGAFKGEEMAKALFGHVGSASDRRLIDEVTVLRAKVRALEFEVTRL